MIYMYDLILLMIIIMFRYVKIVNMTIRQVIMIMAPKSIRKKLEALSLVISFSFFISIMGVLVVVVIKL